ncbi:MAG: hypothetical protein IKZ52_09045 [Bacteroidales bacterium]|nr:hypothetical protein [Bacteroidales bacterium]
MKIKQLILFVCLFILMKVPLNAQDSLLSPKDFGLYEAASDSERYEVLYKTHMAALKANVPVDYSGIDTLTIEITASSQRIPLGKTTDFKGLRLTVRNKSKLCYLFERQQAATSITIDKGLLDGEDFSSVPALANGLYQLVIEDENPWVAKRIGYNYSAIRRDILLICDGQSRNNPVMPYNNEQSKPKCSFVAVDEDEEPVIIQNLTFIRDKANSYKVMPFIISGQNNLQIRNVTINTPESKLVADAAIDIQNCTNVTMDNVTINGTYSRSDYYGYGIQMNNVWNSRFVRLNAKAKWGVFGTNNINTAYLQDCDINRFDIHCYGRDVSMKSCKFSNLYNQFSSMYGTLSYQKCRFVNFIPVLLEPSYNAYTQFNLKMEDCVFDATNNRYFLISAGRLDSVKNSRPELAKKYWPDIIIKNMTVNVPDNVEKVAIFNLNHKQEKEAATPYIKTISIDGMKFNYSGSGHAADLYLSNRYVKLAQAYACNISHLDIIPVTDNRIAQAKTKYIYPASLHPNIRYSAKDVIRISKSRLNYNVKANEAYNIVFERCTLGFVRYTSAVNTAKRTYKNCNIYLNCSDDIYYYIDNHADYIGTLFIPCNPKMQINFIGSHNDVVFKDCRVRDKVKLLYKGSSDNKEFKDFRLKGKR